MGLFDTVKKSLPCDKCGQCLLTWQTKGMGRNMMVLKFEELNEGIEIHAPCNNCGHFNSYQIIVDDGVVIAIDDDDSEVEDCDVADAEYNASERQHNEEVDKLNDDMYRAEVESLELEYAKFIREEQYVESE